MNLGAELVTAVLDTGELQPLLDAGFTREWLNDPVGGREAVFTGDDRDAYLLVLDHWDKHKRVITRKLFDSNYPQYDHGEDPETTVAELLEVASRSVQATLLRNALGGVEESLDDADLETAIEQMGLWHQKISSATEQQSKLQLWDACAIDDLPEPESLIEGFLDFGTLVTLYGKYGTGKSFLAVDWACCLATGTPWQGREVVQTNVLYVAAEGGYGQKKRRRAWEKEFLKGKRIEKGSLFWIIVPVQLQDIGRRSELVRIIRDNNIGLVILDTQAQTTVGMDENSSQEMGQVIQSWMRLRDATSLAGTTVLNIHHENKQGGDRGSTALTGAVDGLYRLRRETGADEEDPITEIGMELHCIKRKDGEPPPTWPIQLQKSPPSLTISPPSGIMSNRLNAPNWSKIVPLIKDGASNEEIKEKLGVTDRTVRRYKQQYEDKYGQKENRFVAGKAAENAGVTKHIKAPKRKVRTRRAGQADR